MSRVYDNWERLVAAVLKRETLRRLALSHSISSSISADFSSRFSFASSHQDVSGTSIKISPQAPSSPSSSSHIDVQPIAFEEIKKATRNFRHRFEHGAWGHVFKGYIDEHTLTASKPGFGITIAVKIWNPEGVQAHQEWSKELNYLSQLRHPNVVRLVGYCPEEENMILVYEFMPKGSLDNHLFRRGNESLSWATRIKVAIDAARALSFLHDKDKPVIHRSFRTADILLDGEFNAKLCDFGLARDGPTGHLTTKCDVYSFGVVLLELLSGRRVIDKNLKEQNLTQWAMPYLRDKRKLLRVMDLRLQGQYPHKEAYTVATVALQCLNAKPKRRPRMAEVLIPLERLQGQ
ncbi:hypothetical protein DH2020_014715 [Rehmannia glutinosa]|uniref:Protein kinase domain-containing protein n=1 Tax=Rehmannia glutinosa TaxID=99300 RepID=A0ABR0X0W1_REHGL